MRSLNNKVEEVVELKKEYKIYDVYGRNMA